MTAAIAPVPARLAGDCIENLSYEIVGRPGAPVIAVLGGISASRHVASIGSRSSAGWWENIVGDGKTVDTRAFQVLSIDYLDHRRDREQITTHDQASALVEALDRAGVDRVHAAIGASYGGMVTLALSEAYPERVAHAIVIGAAHTSHPLASALRVLQRRVVELGLAGGDGSRGVAIARGIALTAYGTSADFRSRFSAAEESSAESACMSIANHLASSGERFAATCTPARFVALSRSLDLHRVNPASIRVPTTLIAVREDQLVPIEQARELASSIAAPCRLVEIDSNYGHDAFLNDPGFPAVLSAALASSNPIMS